jgi:hypothetical protein
VHNLAADLPAPRDDEPADLRRDIVDELADHLHCAVDRERQRAALEGSDPALTDKDQLWARVVARFGHPARIARQLWWDAMKEKIMSQRTQTVTLVVMALFCIVSLTITFVTMADNRRLNQEVMLQLKRLADRPEPQAVIHTTNEGPSEWNNLQVRCVWGTEEGSPAEGVEVEFSSRSENTAGIPPGSATTGEDGVADLGQVLYGTYEIEIATPSGYVHHRSVDVRPGQDLVVTVVCPEGTELAPVTLTNNFDWSALPDALRERAWLVCEVYDVPSGYTMSSLGPDPWQTNRSFEWPTAMQADEALGYSRNGIGVFLIDEAGQILSGRELESPDLVQGEGWAQRSQISRVAIRAFQLPEQPEYLEAVDLPLESYNVFTRLAVADPADATGRTLWMILSPANYGDTDVSRWPHSVGGKAADFAAMYGIDISAPPLHMEFMARNHMNTPLGVLPMGHFPESNQHADMNTGELHNYRVLRSGENTWTLPRVPPDSIHLAELALKVPLGMSIHALSVRPYWGVTLESLAGSPVDVVWRGYLVDSEGKVNLEELVLATGLDPIATPSYEIPSRWSFALPEDVAEILHDYPFGSRLWVRPAEGSAVDPNDISIDESIVSRIRRDSAQYFMLSSQPEAAERMRTQTQEVEVSMRSPFVDQSHPSEPSPDGIQGSSLCDLYLMRLQNQEPKLLLSDRLVPYAPVFTSEDVSAPLADVAVSVTEKEMELIEYARRLGNVVALPAYGEPAIEPYEENPTVDAVMDELSSPSEI